MCMLCSHYWQTGKTSISEVINHLSLHVFTVPRVTYLYHFVEDVHINLLRDDVLLIEVTSTVDVTHPVGIIQVSGVDVEEKLLRLLVNNLTKALPFSDRYQTYECKSLSEFIKIVMT